MNLGPYLTLCAKINSNGIIDIYVKYETIKLQDSRREDICDLRLSKEFLDITPRSAIYKKKITNHISNKGLYPENIFQKNLLNLTLRKKNKISQKSKDAHHQRCKS